jgi:hypothetical protein
MLTKHKIIEAMIEAGQGEPPEDIEKLIRIVINDPTPINEDEDELDNDL